mgnify:CR=1 FL=1
MKKMNEIKIFNNPEFGDVRTMEIDDKPYFNASDVASVLGYSNTRDAISRHCKGVVKHDIGVQTGTKADGTPAIQMVEMSFIPEGDVYRLIVRSKLPQAEKFESWVFDEVLPSIRKSGLYAPDELLNNPDLVIQAMTKLKEERLKTEKLQAEKEMLALENKAKEQVINELRPKLNYLDVILGSKNLLNITQIAKDYGMSGVTMNKILEGLNIQYKQRDQWLLYSKYQSMGYTSSETVSYYDTRGQLQTRLATKWTQKGRLFLYEILKKNGTVPTIEKETVKNEN